MLFCVLVQSNRIWSRSSEISPQAGFHQVWEAKDVDELQEMIWDERVNAAGDPEGTYMCDDCGNESDGEECDNCDSTNTSWEEEDEWVEKNSDFEFCVYEPTKHALLTDYHNSTPRPEHAIAVKAKKIEDTTRELDRAKARTIAAYKEFVESERLERVAWDKLNEI